MANNQDILSDLEFEKQIGDKNDRSLLEFISRQVFDQKKEIVTLAKKVSVTNRRSWENRISFIVLIVALICLGIIDSNLLPFLGF